MTIDALKEALQEFASTLGNALDKAEGGARRNDMGTVRAALESAKHAARELERRLK